MRLYYKPEHDEEGFPVGPYHWAVLPDGRMYAFRYSRPPCHDVRERIADAIRTSSVPPLGSSPELAARRYFAMGDEWPALPDANEEAANASQSE